MSYAGSSAYDWMINTKALALLAKWIFNNLPPPSWSTSYVDDNLFLLLTWHVFEILCKIWEITWPLAQKHKGIQVKLSILRGLELLFYRNSMHDWIAKMIIWLRFLYRWQFLSSGMHYLWLYFGLNSMHH